MPRNASFDEAAIERSPFLTLLTNYMWSHRPPLLVSQLAYKVGMPPQTIWGWIKDGKIPRPIMLDRLAERTGIGRDDLYAAAGYALPGSDVEMRERNSFAHLIAQVERDNRLSPRAKQALIDSILHVELGDAEAEHQRMVYSEQHTTVDSIPAVRRDQAQEHEETQEAPVPQRPQRAQRAAPRTARRRETPRSPRASERTVSGR